MDELNVTQRDLGAMEKLGEVSSRAPGKVGWTKLAMYFRAGYDRPIVAVVIGETLESEDEVARRRGWLLGQPRVFSFKFVCVGTIERALRWFDDSDLTRTLRAQLDGVELPGAQQVHRHRVIPIMEPGTEIKFVREGVYSGAPTSRAPEVGYRGPLRITDALVWLWPDDAIAGSPIGRPMRLEVAFGISRRNVQNALAAERDGKVAPGAWVEPFLRCLRYFDRAAWQRDNALQSTGA